MTLLEDLKRKRVFTHQQWQLICSTGSSHLSLNFDITLMMSLFRNLSNVSPISGQFDALPPPSDTTLGGDLARVKYYRNYISHCLEKDRKLNSNEFSIVWDSAAKAIGRLGGQQYITECDRLLITNLDGSYRDFITEFFGVFKNQNDLKRKIQSENDELKEEIKRIKLKLNDPIPNKIREIIEEDLRQWEMEDKKFAKTYAAEDLNKSITQKNIVIVTGSPGTGKSFTTQHVLLNLRTEGYDVIPVTSANDIVRYFNKGSKQVFYIDDFLGKYDVSQRKFEDLDHNLKKIKELVNGNSSKCIFTCRLQIYQDTKLKALHLDEFQMINLSGDHKLSLTEKLNVAKQYLDESDLDYISDEYMTRIVEDSICFPLLCSLFDKHESKLQDFFQKPEICFQLELDRMLERPDKLKYACIALCVMFNNNVVLDLFKTRVIGEKKEVLDAVLEELEINKTMPKKTIQAGFDSMVGSYFKKTTLGYQGIHDYLFDIFCSHVGRTVLECFINYADSELFSERVVLQSVKEKDSHILHYSKKSMVTIPVEYEEIFFKRMIKEYNNCKITHIFNTWQMQFSSYRLKIKKYILQEKMNFNLQDKDGESAVYICSKLGYTDILNHICESGGDVNLCTNIGISPLLIALTNRHKSCAEMLIKSGANVNICNHLIEALHSGYTDIVKVLCDKEADVNRCDEYGNSPLLLALFGGHTNFVKMFCDKGADVNKCDEYGNSPLLLALSGGYTKIVKILCEKGADVNNCDSYGNSPLLLALFGGHTDILTLFCDKGADVNKCDEYGNSPLLLALSGGYTEIVKILCEKGADVKKCDRFGNSPLFLSLLGGHTDILEIFCDKGEDVNKLNVDGRSPLQLASSGGYTDIVKILCEKGANVNKCDEDGSSSLFLALSGGYTDIVRILCEKGADVNKCDEDGSSALLLALSRGYTDIVKILCAKGADVNKCYKDGSSALLLALSRGYTDIVKILCEKGADVNKCDEDGSSCLFLALSGGYTDIVRILSEKGADVNKCNEDGSSPLLLALSRGYTDTVKILCEKGADVNKCNMNGRFPLLLALSEGYTDIAKILCYKGADVNKCDEDGSSSLLLALSGGYTDLVKILCDKGADVNKCDTDGSSPLLLALLRGHTDTVKILCEKGADVNKCNKDGSSPLLLALSRGYTDTVKILCEKGADVNKCDEDGSSALLLSLSRGYTDIVKILCEKGAVVNKCDKNGRSPFLIASSRGYTDIVKILCDKGGDVNKYDVNGRSSLVLGSTG